MSARANAARSRDRRLEGVALELSRGLNIAELSVLHERMTLSKGSAARRPAGTRGMRIELERTTTSALKAAIATALDDTLARLVGDPVVGGVARAWIAAELRDRQRCRGGRCPR